MTTLIKIENLIPLLLVVLLYSCVTPEIILPGDISGYVQDAATEEPVMEAEVKLFHTKDLIGTDTTGMNGTFLFTKLEPSDYNIEVSNEKYERHNGTLIVLSANTLELEINLQGVPDPEFSTAELNYGMENTQLSFSISNSGGGILSYVMIPTKDWIGVFPESGEIAQESDVIEVTIQREGLREISQQEWIVVHSDIQGEIQVDSIAIYVNYVMDEDRILYRTTRIGTQVWMADNLNTGIMVEAQMNDPTSDNGIIEKLCFDNNALNCDVYGGLYIWEEMMDYAPADTGGILITQGICPDGWHIPTQQEWVILKDYLGEDLAGVMLKDTSALWWQHYLRGTNETAFSALPAGVYQLVLNAGGKFMDLGERAYFWNTYYNDSEVWRVYKLYYYDARLIMNEYSRKLFYPLAMSVRCIQDP